MTATLRSEDRHLTQNRHAFPATDASAPAEGRGQAMPGTEEILARVLSSLEDDKAEDIVQIDLRGRSSIGDHIVIASGRSARQVTAIAEKLVDRLKTELGLRPRIEGKEHGDWVLVDTGDVIVHVFRPEVRDFYQIEKMWQEPGARAPQA